MNSKVYEKSTLLPTGGSAQSFINPSLPKMKGIGDVVSEGLGAVPERPNFWKTPNISNATPFAPVETGNHNPIETVNQNHVVDKKAYVNNGDPTGSVMDYIISGQQDELKYSKDNESKKKLLLLTDALRHMGNLYFTTKGAYPQNLGSSVVGQEERYQTEKSQRQRDRNLVVQQALNAAKQRADEEYKNGLLGQKQAELERKVALDDLNIQLKLDQQKALDDYRKGQLQLGKDNLEAKKAQNAALNKLAQQRINLGYYRANTSSSAGKSAKDKIEIKSYDPNKTMMISKGKLNDATFKSDTRSLYNRLVKSGKITPVTARQYDKNSGEYKYVSKNNPNINEMLEAIQDGSGIVAYMEWANKYADEPIDFVNKSAENRQVAKEKEIQGTGGWRSSSNKR